MTVTLLFKPLRPVSNFIIQYPPSTNTHLKGLPNPQVEFSLRYYIIIVLGIETSLGRYSYLFHRPILPGLVSKNSNYIVFLTFNPKTTLYQLDYLLQVKIVNTLDSTLMLTFGWGPGEDMVLPGVYTCLRGWIYRFETGVRDENYRCGVTFYTCLVTTSSGSPFTWDPSPGVSKTLGKLVP